MRALSNMFFFAGLALAFGSGITMCVDPAAPIYSPVWAIIMSALGLLLLLLSSKLEKKVVQVQQEKYLLKLRSKLEKPTSLKEKPETFATSPEEEPVKRTSLAETEAQDP